MYFAEEKERKMKMRAEREAEIAAHKQAIRQRMIDRQVRASSSMAILILILQYPEQAGLTFACAQVAYLQSLRQNENERTAMQVREAEAKRDAEISAKNEKLQQELQAIKQSHR